MFEWNLSTFSLPQDRLQPKGGRCARKGNPCVLAHLEVSKRGTLEYRPRILHFPPFWGMKGKPANTSGGKATTHLLQSAVRRNNTFRFRFISSTLKDTTVFLEALNAKNHLDKANSSQTRATPPNIKQTSTTHQANIHQHQARPTPTKPKNHSNTKIGQNQLLGSRALPCSALVPALGFHKLLQLLPRARCTRKRQSNWWQPVHSQPKMWSGAVYPPTPKMLSRCCSPPDRKGLLDPMLESAFAMHHAPTQYPAKAARQWIPPSIPELLASQSRRVSVRAARQWIPPSIPPELLASGSRRVSQSRQSGLPVNAEYPSRAARQRIPPRTPPEQMASGSLPVSRQSCSPVDPAEYPARAARQWIPPSIPPERLASGSRQVSRQGGLPEDPAEYPTRAARQWILPRMTLSVPE